MPVSLAPPLDAQQVHLKQHAFGDVVGYVDSLTAVGTPLLLVHSINAAASAYEIRPIFNHYRTRRPTFALDLPGFGLSSRAQRDYSPELYSTCLIQFLREVVGQPADVVALSLGSEFVARASLAEPDLFRSLVLVSPSGIGRKGSDTLATEPPNAATIAHKLVANPITSRALFAPLVSRRSLRFFLSKSFYKPPPQAIIDYAYAEARQPGAHNAPLHFISGRLFTYNAHSALYNKLTTPTLVLYDQDPNVSFDALPELLDENRAIKAQRIANTRGLPHWDEPDATYAALDSFFDSLS